MSGTLRRILGSAIVVDWSRLEGAAALRCTVGVAVPLLAGLAAGQPGLGVFGAAGAVSVGFGSFQGAYRSRAAVMLWAALGMALSVFIGSLGGQADTAAILVAATWAFAGGLLVSLGPAASFVGLQSVVAVLIAGGYPTDVEGAAGRAALVFGGGLVQTLLVVIIWPLRRFSAERRSLAAAFRSLATYAAALQTPVADAPEPHTFAGTASPLIDPQPFARSGDILVFQALLDEAERIRASLAGLAARAPRLMERNPACVSTLSRTLQAALAEIAAALEHARAPSEPPSLWETLEGCARQLSGVAAVDSLIGQVRAAWRTAGVLTTGPPAENAAAHSTRVVPLRRRPPLRDAAMTLRANLTLDSAACRHALRLAATVGIATTAYRLFDLPRGYWVPLTALLILKPEFHDTFARGISRIAGTLVGAGCATLIERLVSPGPHALTALVLTFVGAGYAVVHASYAVFTVCITGYVVFLLMLAGVPELTVATDRVLYTVEGGLLALCIYGLWPTWTAAEVRPALAGLLQAHSHYVKALLAAYADPGRTELRALAEIRSEARLMRSNVEAVVERMLAEPPARHSLDAGVALGLLAAIRRHALAALALHAGLERGVPDPVPGISELSREMSARLALLADILRSGGQPQALPAVRPLQLAPGAGGDSLVSDETDMMVDSVNTIAALLEKQAKTDAEAGEPAS